MNRFLVICFGLAVSTEARADLHDYLKKPEPAYSWKLKEKKDYPQGTTFVITLVSQEWQKITWSHALVIYQPKDMKPRDVMFLWVTGGKPSLGTAAFALEMATKMQAPVAFL